MSTEHNRRMEWIAVISVLAAFALWGVFAWRALEDFEVEASCCCPERTRRFDEQDLAEWIIRRHAEIRGLPDPWLGGER